MLLEGRVSVTLFEATRKKCDFLRAVKEKIGLSTEILNERIETSTRKRFDVLTARACAPLPKLLAYAQHLAGKNTICLFQKGQTCEAELTEATKNWRMKLVRHPSQTDKNGIILEISQIQFAHT